MKGLIIFGNGFEDTEAIATIDVLRRAGLDLDYVSMSDELDVKTQTGLTVKANIKIVDAKLDDYEFLVIPGGRAVRDVLDKSTTLSEIILDFADHDKLIAAICAGPSQVGKLGLYEGRDYTCFPSTEQSIIAGNHLPNEGVVVSGNFITAKAMGYSIDFGLAIVEYLLGKDKREKVRKSAYGEI